MKYILIYSMGVLISFVGYNIVGVIYFNRHEKDKRVRRYAAKELFKESLWISLLSWIFIFSILLEAFLYFMQLLDNETNKCIKYIKRNIYGKDFKDNE